MHQQQVFSGETGHFGDGLTGGKKVLKTRSGICNLDPYLDENSLLRFGERLKKSTLRLGGFYQVINGKDDGTNRLILEWLHQRLACWERGLP